PRSGHRVTEAQRQLNAKPAKAAEQETEWFGGVATRRARPDSDGSANRSDGVRRFVDPSDPIAPAGPHRGPAAEPYRSVSLCLCGRKTLRSLRPLRDFSL